MALKPCVPAAHVTEDPPTLTVKAAGADREHMILVGGPVVNIVALDLNGIAFGASSTTGATIFVAVGASGTLVTSPDAVIWTARPEIGANTLSAVTYGTQFIAVGANGSIFTSTDGTTWVGQPSTTNSDLNAIVHAPYGYSVVGAAGVNLLAK